MLTPFSLSLSSSLLIIIGALGCQNNTDQSHESSKDHPKEASVTKAQKLTLYSGRSMSLIEPLIKKFEAQHGVRVQVRADSSTTLANLILEEGASSPADVFWSQDPEAMALLESRGALKKLPEGLGDEFSESFKGLSERWIPTSGRLRVLAYHQKRGAERPESILDLVKPEYKGRVGWAPTNASFQTFVTALRLKHGPEVTEKWLKGMMANEAKIYPKNTPIITALDSGEIDFGLPNHYYLLQAQKQGRAKEVSQRPFKDGDIGNLMSVAAAAQLERSTHPLGATLIQFLASKVAQTYFAQEIKEYPVLKSIQADPSLASPEALSAQRPSIELKSLKDRMGTLEVLRAVGLL